jgi:hypothetical protein
MIKICVVILPLSFATACNSDSKPIAAEMQKDHADSLASFSRNPNDSLRNPSNYFYLSDLPTRHIGELILSDSIRALQNEISYRCLDSLTSQDASSRSFYFKVFSKVISNPDGPLSEVVGEYAKKYIESYPKEFATYAAGFSKPQKEVWAYQTVEYVLADIEAQKINKASEWTDRVLRSCESCSNAQINAMKDFTSYILRAAKDKEDTDTN